MIDIRQRQLDPAAEMSDAALEAATAVTAVDESGQRRDGYIAAERALTIYLDKLEIMHTDDSGHPA